MSFLVRTEMGLQVHDGRAELADDRLLVLITEEPERCGRVVCAWCGAEMGPVEGLSAGTVSHGMCQRCSDNFLTALDSPTSQPKPSEDRGAQPAAAQGARLRGVISARPHPQGGWTLAYPTSGSAKTYHGHYTTEAAALNAAWRANNSPTS